MVKISGKRDPEYLARKRAREQDARGKPTFGFANATTLEGVEEYQAFEFPQGSGITWRVEAVSFTTGARITELELELAAIHTATQEHAERQSKQVEAGAHPDVDLPLMRKLSKQWNDVIARGAALAGPLMIPTSKWRLRYKLLKRLHLLRLWRNPIHRLGGTAHDVAWLIGFLARCQMKSRARIRHLAVNASDN
jgi:hypothetical protein